MDLQAAEKLNGKFWNLAKIGAFACFVAAGLLLVGSLYAKLKDAAREAVLGTTAQIVHNMVQ